MHHLLWHLPDLIILIGALIIVSQFPMERHIGDLGGQIRLHSNPYANLSQRAYRRCQENALKALDSRFNRAHQQHRILTAQTVTVCHPIFKSLCKIEQG